jgi:AraC-like DNA-binding protein
VWKSQAPSDRWPLHFHTEPEVNLLVRGSATFHVGDAMLHAAAGELLAFPAGLAHALLEASPDLQLCAIDLEPTFSADVLEGGRQLTVPVQVRVDANELESVLDGVVALAERPDAEHPGAGLGERIYLQAQRAIARAACPIHVVTRRALARMSKTPGLRLEALARELRVHPSELSRRFRHDMGMTFVRYRTRQCLLRVIRLFETGQYDLMGVASAAGFGSYSQCHRAFRAELGCSPSAFFRY